MQVTARTFKISFYASLVLMLVMLLISGYGVGLISDEMDMNMYGKANISYYLSGGKDTTYLHPSNNDGTTMASTMPYYGSAFEYIATPVTALLGDEYEYNTRHVINQLVAVLGLLFTGLAVARIKNYQAALTAVWLIFLTPIFSGLALFDTKDIPFVTGYMGCIYFTILFFDNLPKPKMKILLGLGLSIWFLLSIRIGGLLLVAVIFMFAGLKFLAEAQAKQTVKTWGLRLGAVVAGAFILMILAWPFVLSNPSEHIPATISAVKNFPQRIPLNFEGEQINSLQLPGNYLTRMLSITIPAACIIFILVGSVLALVNAKKTGRSREIIFLLVSGLLPVVYAMYSKMPLYNSWRHLLFFYPPMIAAASVGVFHFLEGFKKPVVEYAVMAALLLGMLHPMLFTVRNTPYQYTYFNELSGGFKKVYYEYETDYWQISVKEAIDWLVKNEHIEDEKDSVIIATNAYSFSNHYYKTCYKNRKVRFMSLGEKSNFAAPGKYCVFNNLFLEPTYLENSYPSPYAIHTVDVDGLPICYVSKDEHKYLFKGYSNFQTGNYPMADSFFSLYLKETKFNPQSPRNVGAFFGMIAFAKLGVEKLDEGEKYASLAVGFNPRDYISNMAMGVASMVRGRYPDARKYLQIAQNLRPNEPAPSKYLSMIPNQ